MGISPFMSSGCSCVSKCKCNDEYRNRYNVPDIYRPKAAKKKKKKAKVARVPLPKVPDPSKFNILKMQQVGEWTIVKVQYVEAVNYEGKKIMVYRATPAEVQDCKILDPHFCDGEHLSPFARFEPTEKGWKAATRFALTAY